MQQPHQPRPNLAGRNAPQRAQRSSTLRLVLRFFLGAFLGYLLYFFFPPR